MKTGSGKIWVGDADGNAVDVAVSGDVSLAASGAATVNAAKLAASENAYIKTDAGVKDLLAAASVARQVMVAVTVTTAFADGDGTQPTLTIGEEGSAAKFAAAAAFTGAAASTVAKMFAGTLSANKKLQGTLVAGTGTTETGAYKIDIHAVS